MAETKLDGSTEIHGSDKCKRESQFKKIDKFGLLAQQIINLRLFIETRAYRHLKIPRCPIKPDC